MDWALAQKLELSVAKTSFEAMSRSSLNDMTVAELVDRFATLALEQDDALLMDEIARVNRLFDQLEDIKHALRSRAGDQRKALMVLYRHPNAQVRLKAAKGRLAVAPAEARNVLQTLIDGREFPQAGDAGMTIRALDDGTFVPT